MDTDSWGNSLMIDNVFIPYSATLTDFLWSARLGPLNLGMRRTRAFQILGSPDCTESCECNIHLWGCLQLNENNGRIVGIGIICDRDFPSVREHFRLILGDLEWQHIAPEDVTQLCHDRYVPVENILRDEYCLVTINRKVGVSFSKTDGTWRFFGMFTW